MDKIKVPKSKFDEMGTVVSCQSIIEKGKALGVVDWGNLEFVMTSAVGNGTGKGWKSIDGYRVIDKINYKGLLEPLLYDQHWVDVEAGNRQRGYTGMLIKYLNRELVLIQCRTFICDEADCVQAVLF